MEFRRVLFRSDPFLAAALQDARTVLEGVKPPPFLIEGLKMTIDAGTQFKPLPLRLAVRLQILNLATLVRIQPGHPFHHSGYGATAMNYHAKDIFISS